MPLSRIFQQLGRLKLGNPPNTGITGDQVVSGDIISSGAFQQAKNNLNIDQANKAEMENLKLIGDVTGMSGASTIIPGTGQIASVESTADTQTLITPKFNEVVMIHAVEWEDKNANAGVLEITDPDGLTCRLQAITGGDSFSSISQASGKYLSYPLTLTARYDTRSGSNRVTCAYSRVK